MKNKSFLAFLFTLFALLIVMGGGIYSVYTRLDTDCDGYSFDVELEKDNLNLEPCQGELVKLMIENTGKEDDIYRILLKGPTWVMVKPAAIKVDAGEKEEVSIYVSPPIDVKGQFKITVEIESECSTEDKIISVKV